jgi:hypothetical protein
MLHPFPSVPRPGTSHVAKAPEAGDTFVPARAYQRPAFASRQFHNAMDVGGIDQIALPDLAMQAFAMPGGIRPDVEYLLHVTALKNLSLKRPGVIVRIRMGFLEPEAVEHPTIIEMVFGERPRHAFDPNDRGTGRDMVSRRTRYPQRHTEPLAVPVGRLVSTTSLSPGFESRRSALTLANPRDPMFVKQASPAAPSAATIALAGVA